VAASEPSSNDASVPGDASFFVRHEFLIRRLHSFTGLMAGGFMCVHLLVNASVANSPETFQNSVYGIHALGKILPLVEWAFIFAPLLFHAVVGVWIAKNASHNTAHYRYESNFRYTLQRYTGYILFGFVLYHVFHMHGWFHWDWWLAMAEPLGGHQFRPYNATSSAGLALRGWLTTFLYAGGVLCGVYHLTNGIWTAGITWGLWTTPRAQRGALKVCGAAGGVLAVIGLTALIAMRSAAAPGGVHDLEAAENRIYDARVKAGSVMPNEHKRTSHPPAGSQPDSHPGTSTDQALLESR